MKSLLIFVVFGTAVCFPRSSGTEKAELKNVSQRKEFLTKAKKFIDEIKTMFHKAVVLDNKFRTGEDKVKAFSALEKENPKAYAAVWGIATQFMSVIDVPGSREPVALAIPGVKEEEWRKEVHANVAKLIDGLYAALKRRIDILDDKSKTSVEKLKSLAKLAQEDSTMEFVLQIMIGQI